MKRIARLLALATACLLTRVAACGAAEPAFPEGISGNMELDPWEAAGYIVDPGAVAGIYRHLSERMAAMTASGRTAVLRIHEHGSVRGNPAVLLAYGEEKQGEFTPVDFFAVDEGGRVYEKVNDTEYLLLEEKKIAASSTDVVFVDLPYEAIATLVEEMRSLWNSRGSAYPLSACLIGISPFRFIVAVPPPVG